MEGLQEDPKTLVSFHTFQRRLAAKQFAHELTDWAFMMPRAFAPLWDALLGLSYHKPEHSVVSLARERSVKHKS